MGTIPDPLPPSSGLMTKRLPGEDVKMAEELIRSVPDTEIMIRQPESSSPSQETLKAEVSGIYAGLTMAESKAIEVLQSLKDSLTDEQWKALITLHCVVLREQYDFFLASQHPKASPSLRHLPTEYNMPARLWKHGIHTFLEAMRHRLPGTRETMLTFMYTAYAMMCLLEETVPQFRMIWTECKGDLGRFRMAVEDKYLELRQQWKKTSAEQYSQGIDHDPLVGRLYHHLAILNRTDSAVPQFFYFIKALVVKTPFFPARYSIFTVTDSILKKEHTDPFLTAVAHLVLASQSPEIRREKGHNTSKHDHHQSCCRALKELLPDGGATEAATCLDSEEKWHVVGNEIRLLASLDAHILLQSRKFDKTYQPTAISESTLAPSDETDQPVCTNENKEAKPTRKVQAYTLRPSHELGVLLCILLLGIPQSDKTQSTMMAAWAPDYVNSADRADLAAKVASGIDVYEDAELAALLAAVTITHILKRADTTDVQFWEFLHVILVFMRAMMTRPDMHERFGWAFSAQLLAPFLNMALRDAESRGRDWNRLSQPEFPTMNCAKKTMQQTPFTTPLPEDKALRGLFFARQSGSRTGPQVNSTDPKSSVPVEATEAPTGIQEQAEPSKEHKEALAEEVEKKAEEARLQNVEDEKAESRDPDFFPCRWFDESQYDFEEETVRNGSIQDEETCLYRIDRILWTASQLTQRSDGTPGFLSLETDEGRCPHIVAPGVPSLPQTCPHATMPEVVERDGGVRVVFVDPCLIEHAARQDRYYELQEVKRREKVKEKRKEAEVAEAAGDSAAAIDDPMTAHEMELIKASYAETEHEEAKAACVLLHHQAESDHNYSATNEADKTVNNRALREGETEAEDIKPGSGKKESSLSDSENGESEEDQTRENGSEAVKDGFEDAQNTMATDALAATITGTADQCAVTEQQLNKVARLKKDLLDKVLMKEEEADTTMAEGDNERDWVCLSESELDDDFYIE